MKKRLMLFAAMSLLAIGGAVTVVDNNAKEDEPVVAKAAAAKLPQPDGFVANLSADKINVTFAWNGGSTKDAKEVHIFVSDSKGNAVEELNDKAIVNGHVSPKSMFVEDETYSAYIVAKGDGVNTSDSDNSASVNFIFESPKPVDPDNPVKLGTPSGFIAEVDKETGASVRFAWANVADATAYHLFVKDSKEAAVVGLVDCPIGNGQTFPKDRFVAGETYSAYIIAKADGYIDSEPSAIVTFSFKDEIAKLAKPQGFSADASNGTSVTFAWANVENANQYNIFVKDSKKADVTGLVDCPTANGQTFPKNRFVAGETYTAYIIAKGAGYRDSDPSDPATFSFPADNPDQPTKLPTPNGFAANVNGDLVTFAWDGSTTDKANEVRVFVKDSNREDVVGLVDCPITNGQAFPKADKFVAGETYSAYLVAKGDGTKYLDSDKSAVVTFKFEVDVVKNFVTKWAEMRKKGGADGICAVASSQDAEFMALIQEFKDFTDEQKAAIRGTEDVEGVTIGQTMDYLSGRFEWFRNQEVATPSNEANFLTTAMQDDTLLVVAVIGLASVLAVVAYIYSEKKKFANK